ncbi:hypothetical protein [Micromonospora sp. NPDC023633]|uniref:hypothetical protein n=1 Tax=Micromonospora sp. NPDC023633 TaxID=3154320 RepID=UPI0034030E93
MPQQVLARSAVVGVVLVGALALCGLTVKGLSTAVSLADEAECTESDHQLAEQLTRDPLLTSPPPGTTLDRVGQLPCGDESNPWRRVRAEIGLPPGTSMDPVLRHYRGLLTAGHWRISPEPGKTNLFCADRVINEQQVRLLLGYGRAMPGPQTYGELGIEVNFLPDGENLSCHG